MASIRPPGRMEARKATFTEPPSEFPAKTTNAPSIPSIGKACTRQYIPMSLNASDVSCWNFKMSDPMG